MDTAARAERIFDEACGALRKMHYNLAFDLFTEVMELEPENPDVHYNRGLAAGNLLRWEEAERNFDMALRLRLDPDYLTHRALARLHLRHWQEALDDLESVLGMERENEYAKIHRQGLVDFLGNAGRGIDEVPDSCAEWFDERLLDFVGVDPEIVNKADRAGLRKYLAEAFGDEGPGSCDHTLKLTEEWALENRRDAPGVCRFLYERGLKCDCQVLAEGSERADR